MAYEDFTFSKLKNKFGIEQEDVFLFGNESITMCSPSQRLFATAFRRPNRSAGYAAYVRKS